MACDGDDTRAYKDTSCYMEVPFEASEYFKKCWMKTSANLSDDTENLGMSSLYSRSTLNVAGTLIGIESIGGVLLNAIMLIILLRKPDLRKEYLTPSIISIALSDFLFCLICLPLLSLHFFMEDMLSPSCKVFGFLTIGMWYCSAWSLLGVAVLRLVGVYFPGKTNTTAFEKASRLTPCLAWAISWLSMIPTLLPRYGSFELECKSLMCISINIDSEGHPIKTGAMDVLKYVVGVMTLMMLILNVATYLKISRQIRKAHAQMKDTHREIADKILEKERKAGRMMAIITLLFFIVYCPNIILRRAYPDAHFEKPIMVLLTYLIGWSSGIIDPIIYIICQERYQKEIKELLQMMKTSTTCSSPSQNQNSNLTVLTSQTNSSSQN